MIRRNLITKILVSVTVLLIVGVAPFSLFHNAAYSLPTNMPNRSLIVQSAVPSDTNVLYDFTFDLTTAGSLGSVLFKFCSNSPLIADPCTQPSGFDATSALINTQFGETGFTIHPSSDANNIIITRTPIAIGPTPRSVGYEFSGITNADVAGSQYVRITSYVTTDASGSQVDEGGVAYSLSGGISISTTVPPYLLFCSGVTISGLDCLNISGSGINVGLLEPTTTAIGTSQLLIATNAESGYTISTIGTTLTAGNFAIDGMTTKAVSAQGTNQFGLNLRSNTTPIGGTDPSGPGLGIPSPDYNTPNQFKFVNGDILASNGNASDINKFTASYIVNITDSKEPGIYSTTLTFLALATF